MNIDKQFLTVSNYNRPGIRRDRTTAVACHYIGNPGTSAQANRNYFENLRITHTTKASCHYIIGLAGEIIQLIPEEEVSWCTNQANSYTISIEACHPDATGKFTDATYQSYVALCADICKRWGLDPQRGGLIRHYDVTGKICPKWFVEHLEDWEQFKADVAGAMAPLKSGWYQEGGGWRFYLGDTGQYVANDWYEDGGKWYWFRGDGLMVSNTWYQYDDGGGNRWYYLGQDGAMVKGQQTIDGKWYVMDDDGKMIVEPVVLVPDRDGALQWPGLAG